MSRHPWEDRATLLRATALATSTLCGVLVITVIRPAVTLLRSGKVLFQPDLWETLLGAMSAAHGQQLIGAWSRIGIFHPGPMWFYWCAPFVALSGDDPSALTFAAATLVAICIIGVIVRIGSLLGATAAAVATAVLAVAVFQLGTFGLMAPWNPTVLMLPLVLGVVCAADGITRGTAWSMTVGVICGAFVAQAHLGALPIGLLIVGASVVGGMRHRIRAGSGMPPLRAMEVAVLFTALMLPWMPVALDEVSGTGNSTNVAAYVLTDRVPDDATPTADSGQDLSIVGAIRHLGSIAAISEPATAAWAGIDLGSEHEPGLRSDLVSMLLVVAAIFGAIGPARRRTLFRASTANAPPPAPIDHLALWLCRSGLAILAIQVVSVIRVRHAYRPYLIASAAGTGIVLWLGLALLVTSYVRRAMRDRAIPADVILGALAGSVTVLALVATLATSPRVVAFPVDERGSATIDAVLSAAGGRPVQIDASSDPALLATMRLTWRLEQAGTRVGVDGRFRAHFGDRQRRYAPDDAFRLRLIDERTPIPSDCEDLGAYGSATVCAVR